MPRYANVALPARVFHPFAYAIPEGMELVPGMRVVVPFHRRKVVGTILDILDEPPVGLDIAKLKTIETSLDESPTFSPSMLTFIRWMARYYCAPIGDVCTTALPRRLTQVKALQTTRATSPHEILGTRGGAAPHSLTVDQHNALTMIRTSLSAAEPRPILLHGITGSGKTEVYLQLLQSIEAEEGQGILLVPEIGLTPQLSERVRMRFGNKVALYHSGLTDAQRHDQWMRMKLGHVSIVVGTRSALFAPFSKLRTIIVDEEHDSSYKQEEGVLYHARDAAIMRAKLEGAVVVLGSATPSLESYAHAQSGKYSYAHLSMRPGGAALPSVELVDMREKGLSSSHAFPGSVALTPKLLEAIDQTLVRKEQILLFLNRRGFAHFLLCTSCGFVFECPNCSISLTHHQGRGKLICHYCDYVIPVTDECPACKLSDLLPMGSGTERLEAELTDFFPNARIARLDRDTLGRSGARTRIYRDMHAHKIDILVGTQLITKGHDFPNVTLVGILQADAPLHFPDFRAAERTFQLITQVAGRAGRAEKPGKVIVQTYQPEHHSLQCAVEHDFAAFFADEEKMRRALSYPPFGRLANLKFSGNNKSGVEKAAYDVAAHLRREIASRAPAIALLGPASAPLEKVRNKYRWHLLLKSPSANTLKMLLRTDYCTFEIPQDVRLTIDVDPVNLL